MTSITKLFMIFIIAIFFMLFLYLFIFKKKIDKENIKYHLNEFKKSRALVGTLCLVVALIISFVITPMFNQMSNKKIQVLEVARDIKIGEKLESSMFREVEVGSYGINQNIVRDKSIIIDKYATKEMFKGQYLYHNQISDKIPYNDEYLYNKLNGVNRAISFTVKDLAVGVSNKLIQGDIISIIINNNDSNEEEGEEETYIPDELKYVEVLTTTNSTGFDVSKITDEDDDILYQTITCLVYDEQAKIIANAEATKQIHIELVYRAGSEEVKNYLLKKQEEILNEKYEDRISNVEVEKEQINKILNKKEENKENKEYENNNGSLNEINEMIESLINEEKDNNEEYFEEYEDNIEETKESESVEETTKAIEETKESESIEETTKSQSQIEREEYERIKREYNAI